MKNRPSYNLSDRLLGALASLFFSVPAFTLLWLLINRELALTTSAFLGSGYLWGAMGFGFVLAFALPGVFPAMLGGLWHWIVRWLKFWA